MAKRSHSKISKLDPCMKETVDEMIKTGVYYMIKTGVYYRDIAEYIRSHGISISVAAVGKYAKNLMSTLDALRLSQENFRIIMEETEKYKNLDVTDGILRLLSNQVFQAINNLPEEQVQEINFETLMKNAVALTKAVAYKKKIDIDSQSVLENGADQFQNLIFEAMAEENPELYKQVKKFIKEKQS